MATLSVVPAYGRDYKNKKAIEADLAAGKDFLIVDLFGGQDGRYVNLENMRKSNITKLQVRYKCLTAVTIINVNGI